MPSTADLLSDVHRARQAWRDALQMLDFVAPEFLDCAVYHLSATERRFVALLQEARRNGVTAWKEEQLRPAVVSGAPEREGPATAPETDAGGDLPTALCTGPGKDVTA